MDQPVLIALIGAVSAIGGALVAGIATWANGRLKLRELQVTYEQKLEDKYLENARQYINGVYVPLSLALSKLAQSHRLLRASLGESDQPVPVPEEEAFRSAIKEYLGTVESLRQRGADAFLTNRLDEELSIFYSFLEASLDATEPVVRMEYRFRIGVAGLEVEGSGSAPLRGKTRRLWSSPPQSLSLFGNYLTYSANELLAAPPISKEFSKRLAGNIPALKTLIKEVTLGARGISS